MHGYAITAHIHAVSDQLLRVEEGSLYPALHRMEQACWVRAEWGVTEKNREARFYSCSMLGVIRFVIRLYQCTLSPIIRLLCGPDFGCRFTPTC